MKEPLFSILIANYNNGRYLQEAIDSVLTQTYTNWEVILVDDKSTDNSFEIYEKYKNDSRFHIFFNEENKGCGYTKRRCAELAKGELCGFLDPDDKLESNALEIMVQQHNTNPRCSLIYSTLYLWDDINDSKTILEDVGAMEEGEDFLISSKKMVSQFAVYKNEAYRKTKGINQYLQSAVDIDEYYSLEEVGELFYINIPLYYYRQTNTNSISIGSSEARSKALTNRFRTSLIAFSRRIRTNHPLYLKNKDKYLFLMRWQMEWYKKMVGYINCLLIKSCWTYIVANRFSLRSYNHIRKIIFK